jgi:toxin YoeB
MIYEIQYTDEALQAIEKYKKSNPIAYKKISRLIPELTEHPREGTGHPEPLAGGDDITYSRHISKKNRIVYDIFDDIVVVIIVSVEGHYEDK